jgi:hypothetical protein
MSLSRQQAQEALRDIAQTERRSFSAYGYKSAAPFLILWGVLWLVGYGGTDLFPTMASWIWLAVAAVGSFASAIIGIRTKSGTGRFSWRIFFTWLAALAALSSVLTILRPADGAQIGAIIPLIVGWAYVILGIWMGVRLSIAGLAIVILTLVGFFYLPAHFALWMAIIGGATLSGTGLWLRSI